MKKTFCSIVMSIFFVIICIGFAIFPIRLDNAYADNESNIVNIEELCAQYTSDLLLTGEPAGGNTIFDYENYIDARFDTSNIYYQNAR